MGTGRRIATLNHRELYVLCRIFLRHPFYLLPTYRATKRAVAISDRLYGELHHEDNRTNAFRHALWNYLICKYCLPHAGSPQKAMSWSKKITDLHEKLAPNDELPGQMDLHNNRIGRELFLNSIETEDEVVQLLQQMTLEARQIGSIREIEEEKKNLVFIESLK